MFLLTAVSVPNQKGKLMAPELSFDQALAIKVSDSAITRIYDQAKWWAGARLSVCKFAVAGTFTALTFNFGVGFVSGHPELKLVAQHLPWILIGGSMMGLFGDFIMKRSFVAAVLQGTEAEKAAGSKVNSFAGMRSGSIIWEWRYDLIYLSLMAICAGVLGSKFFGFKIFV